MNKTILNKFQLNFIEITLQPEHFFENILCHVLKPCPSGIETVTKGYTINGFSNWKN